LDRLRVELIAATPKPQQCMCAAMPQDFSEGFVAADRTNWPDETPAGEICVKRLLERERGHYGPLEHALRAKLGTQDVIRVLCDLLWPHFVAWAAQIAVWYEKSRSHRARLAP
jgi:thymidylate synthase ThyX